MYIYTTNCGMSDILNKLRYICPYLSLPRVPLQPEHDALTNYVSNMFRWQVFQAYMYAVREKDETNCLRTLPLVADCAPPKLLVAKILRANMETMEPLLPAMPDLHILHYFRDPCSISISTALAPYLLWETVTADRQSELAVLYGKMVGDVAERERLDRKYPGASLTAPYEQLVHSRVLYNFVQLPEPPQWLAHAHEVTYAENAVEVFYMYVNNRQKATETVKKWYKNILYRDLDALNNKCSHLLEHLKYKLFPDL